MLIPIHPNALRRAFRSLGAIYYGWVIVMVCTLMMGVAYGIMYSFSVFFMPLVDHFHWDRATVSSIYSLSLILRGAVAIGIGWLADRYGPMKLSAFCGVMIMLGLALASRVTELWQFYLAYGLVLSIGLSGAFTIGSAVTAQWFQKKRGVALGIVSTGSGFGTLMIVPLTERLLKTHSWSWVFVFLGVGAGVLVTGTAFLLKSAPMKTAPQHNSGLLPGIDLKAEKTLKSAAFSKEMVLLLATFSFVAFCVQMVMIHLANLAIDAGVSSFQAATFIGVIGVVSIFGRVCMGRASDTIGTANALIICSILRVVALIWLLFCRSPAGFYGFAVLFGFAYGGEIPQIPMFIVQFFGIRAMAALMGLMLFVSNIGGALGPLAAGKIFDATLHYRFAIMAAIVAAVIVWVLALQLKKMSLTPSPNP